MADAGEKLEESLRYETIDDKENDDGSDEDEIQSFGDWDEEDGNEEGSDSSFLCLFCDSTFTETDPLFSHCISTHHFDFQAIRRALRLDFYGSLRLINFVRSQVAKNRCWSCDMVCQSNEDLQTHLHGETISLEEIKPLWDNDEYFKPFLQDDPLLHRFCEDDDDTDTEDEEECATDVNKFDGISATEDVDSAFDKSCNDGSGSRVELEEKTNDEKLSAYFPNRLAKDVKFVNEDYFGSYSSFGIHREMLGDKVRMDAYSQAILKNPSLLNGAVVLDVGCGTGILSCFAAQARASRVIAVEASEKMAAIATRIAKNNGLLQSRNPVDSTSQCSGVVEVVQCMVEDLEKNTNIEPHSVDVLVSEWMGYCLLYESMLSSVLFARDRWLKPGGAILPDTATIIVAGFGKGGTSLSFWENVYGIKMSCVGKDLVEDAARFPIVDTVESHDLVTNATVLKTFDLATMRPDEVDFTSSVELEPKSSNVSEPKTTLCYGVVLWFETGFTSRYCKETPAVLSTSPCTPKTHWYQTILTFREPIAVASGESRSIESSAAIGTDGCPAGRVNLRISIARASQHRSIDISMETTGIALNGQKRSWPLQFFSL